jgi:hypothetical protein
MHNQVHHGITKGWREYFLQLAKDEWDFEL